MLGATHTMVLMKILELAGRGNEPILMPGESAMVFGNLLPDSLPLVGISPDVSHDIGRADKLSGALSALGTGVKVHIYADNLTHCNNVIDDGNYGASIALRLGFALMKETDDKFSELIKRFSPRSIAYTLHTIIELAADVLAANDKHIVAVIEQAWADTAGNYGKIVNALNKIYEVDIENMSEGHKKFLSQKRPSPEEIYSRGARAEMFIRKFAPNEYDDDRRAEDRMAVMDLIEAGENMLRDKLSSLASDFAFRIMDFEPELKGRIDGIVQSGKFLFENREGSERI